MWLIVALELISQEPNRGHLIDVLEIKQNENVRWKKMKKIRKGWTGKQRRPRKAKKKESKEKVKKLKENKEKKTTNGRPLPLGFVWKILRNNHTHTQSWNTKGRGNSLRLLYFDLAIMGMKLSSMNPRTERSEAPNCYLRTPGVKNTHTETGKGQNREGDYKSDETQRTQYCRAGKTHTREYRRTSD